MAYGARLESVLGESPRGFESPILRQLSDLALGMSRHARPATLEGLNPSPPPALCSSLGPPRG